MYTMSVVLLLINGGGAVIDYNFFDLSLELIRTFWLYVKIPKVFLIKLIPLGSVPFYKI